MDRMMSKTALGHQQDLHPVIRTLYDHSDVCVVVARPNDLTVARNAAKIHSWARQGLGGGWEKDC